MQSLRPRLVAAIVVSTILLLLAPFFGEVRRILRASFPTHFVLILGAAVAAMVVAALGVALVRVRDRRVLRYGAIAASVGIATGYSIWTAGPDPQVNAVERFHFLQYGLITFLFYRAWRPLEDASILILPVLAAFLMGTAEEWFQWFIPARVGEMRDVFLNSAAIGCGLLFCLGIDPPGSAPFHLHPGSAGRIGRFAAAALIVFAAFVHSVHLGHAVSDPETGTFRSRYTAARLRALARDREEAWKTAPPVQRPPRVSREDQYMSEALLHVQERNQRWEAGDFEAAWRENLILERFYAPVLDAPSYVSPNGHRWPPEQRADAARRTLQPAGDPARAASTYVSDADEGFIRTWSRPVYWAVVLAAAALASLVGSWLGPKRVAVTSSRAPRTAHHPAER